MTSESGAEMQRCHSCGHDSFTNTGETGENYPDGDPVVALECDRCSVETWVPLEVAPDV